MANCLFDTYKNYVISYGKHMLKTEYDMAMKKMCEYPSSNYTLPHWKYKYVDIAQNNATQISNVVMYN